MTTIFSEILINVSQKKDEGLAFFLNPVIKVVFNPFSNSFYQISDVNLCIAAALPSHPELYL
jgi:hypothetical protein